MGSVSIVLPAIDTSITSIAVIKEELERRRFPSILTDDDYQGIITGALRDMGRYNPLRSMVSFNTVAGQQDYLIFDTYDATTSGVCATARDIIDVLWNGKEAFEIIGNIGAPTAYLRLHPLPTEVLMVHVDMCSTGLLTSFTGKYADLFWQWVEYYVADTLANLYATTAGIDLLNFSDSTAALKYWQGKAEKYLQRALDTQAGMQQGIVGRS